MAPKPPRRRTHERRETKFSRNAHAYFSVGMGWIAFYSFIRDASTRQNGGGIVYFASKDVEQALMNRRHLKKRYFVQATRTGRISIRSTPHLPVRTEETVRSFDLDELLVALLDVEVLLAPAFVQEHVPPALCIAFLADDIYGHLTGEEEIQSPELRATLAQFVLTAWSSGTWTPRPAFPYTLDQVVADFPNLPDDHDAPDSME